MSLEQARRSGLAPPVDWQPPPRDGVAEIARTGRVFGRMLVTMAIDLARNGKPTRDSTSTAGYAEVQAACRAHARAIGIDVTVRGVERVPASGGLVFMWNQTSHLDHLLLPIAIPRPFHVTYNNEVRRFPIYGRYLATSDHFWIDRTDEAQWRKQVATAADRVRDGACVLISPEGTRSWDGRLLPMKRGAFVLARAAGRPIVCVTVCGARACLPRGRAGIRPGPVTIELSKPIPTDTPGLEEHVVETFESALSGNKPDRG